MATKSASSLDRLSLRKYRRSVITHLIRQSGDPTPDPREMLRLARDQYDLVPREAQVGRFTARVSRLVDDRWAIDFNPCAPKLQLVTAIWHELSELLCLSDDVLSFEGFNSTIYQESATSAYDLRHICAVGVERYVWRKLMEHPDVRAQRRSDTVRRLLMARGVTASTEPLLTEISRERWYEDESEQEAVDFVM